MALACLALGACLEGERAPLWTTYGDPASQVPAIGAQTSATGASSAASTLPGLPALGPPVATTTTTTQETVQVWGPPGTTITSRTLGGQPPVWSSTSSSSGGQPRFVYPRNDIRCDNLLRRCDVWSAPRGRYLFDRSATRAVFGP